MKTKNEIIDSTLNEIGRDWYYRKKELLIDRFFDFFDNTTFNQINDGFMGWVEYESSCGSLFVSSARFDGGEWLRHVRHKTKANNPYNNFVNAFCYWDLMNEKGHSFFMENYNTEIVIMKSVIRGKIASFKSQIKSLEQNLLNIDNELKSLI